MKNKGWVVLVVVICAIVLLFGVSYNSLQRADENVNEKWAQVENQLQRRYDLIPQLVAVVKQYTDYEASTLESIVSLRGDGSLGEDSQLMTDLAGTENRIAVARKDYNDAVSSLNKKIRSFPMNIIANMSGVDSRYYFEASDNASEIPNVSELFNQ